MEPAQANQDPTARFASARAAAGALIRNSDGDILMVQPTYKDFWDLPGGYIETGEQPSDACRREVHEELGLDIELGVLLVVDWAPAPGEGDKVLFVFDGGRLTPEQEAAIELPKDELRTWTYQPVAQIETITPARLARRILQAAQAKTTIYLEAGRQIAEMDRLSKNQDPRNGGRSNMANNAVYALPSAGIVVRITCSTKLHERIRKGARLSAWFARVDAPTIRLAGPSEQPLVYEDLLATV